MERSHEFTINVPGEGTYVIKLLEGVEIEQQDGVIVGRWPAFHLDAESASEAAVYQELLGGLQKQISGGPDSPGYGPFAAYVREHGTRLSDEEVAAQELARVRAVTSRWHVTDDEQYTVQLWQDAELQRDGDTVTVSAFGLEGSGQQVGQALQVLNGAVNEACGTHDAPGPRFDEFVSIDEAEMQLRGHELSDRGLSRPHESDQCDVAHLPRAAHYLDLPQKSPVGTQFLDGSNPVSGGKWRGWDLRLQEEAFHFAPGC